MEKKKRTKPPLASTSRLVAGAPILEYIDRFEAKGLKEGKHYELDAGYLIQYKSAALQGFATADFTIQQLEHLHDSFRALLSHLPAASPEGVPQSGADFLDAFAPFVSFFNTIEDSLLQVISENRALLELAGPLAQPKTAMGLMQQTESATDATE